MRKGDLKDRLRDFLLVMAGVLVGLMILGLLREPSDGGVGNYFERLLWKLAPTVAPSTQLEGAAETLPVAASTQVPASRRPAMRAYRDEENMYVLGSQYLRESIYTIRFLDSLANIPANADVWDVSTAGDGSVLAWVTPTNYDLYDLTIAGDGGVIAPIDCSYLFACYYYVAEISFNNCFDTSSVTNMAYMFWNVSTDALAERPPLELDLKGFDTSNVTNMNSMFAGCCAKLIDISSFDTSKVTDMGNMFYYCSELQSIPYSSSFVFPSNGNIDGMFDGCPYLRP